MTWHAFLAIYILFLVITIILVAMKKTHWSSIIGVGLIPIYFIWVLIDAFQVDIRKQVVHEYESNRPHVFSANDFSNADLSGLGLSGAQFTSKVMRSTNLSRSALAYASFWKSDLTGANLSWTVLTEAYLCDADLSDADLTSANLFRANLANANLEGANLSLADLGQAIMPDGKKYSRGMDLSKFGAKGTPMDI